MTITEVPTTTPQTRYNFAKTQRVIKEETRSGIDVKLHWIQATNTIWVSLKQGETVDAFQVPGDKAQEAFEHPFVYQAIAENLR